MRRSFLSVIFLSLAICCAAQKPVDTLEAHVRNSLITWYKKYPQEKVFIHTNQQLYGSGETIWYKAYVTAYGKPSALSGIVYVQLTDSAGNIVAQNKLPLVDGTAHGNIDLSPNLKSGWYRLSSFTSWMMNFDRQAWYSQQIYISNPSETITFSYRQPGKKQPRIFFYPEGGDIIGGVVTKIAFRAVDDDGHPVAVRGVINDRANKEVVRFGSVHDGMGEFMLEAPGNNSYSADIAFSNGTRQRVSLPEVKTAGISLQADQTDKSIQLKLSFAGPKERFEDCVLAASQTSGQVVTHQLKLDRGINLFELPKAGFSTGILRLTIFSHDAVPLAERILFLNQHDLTISALKADTLSFSPTGRNSFSLTITGKTGLPVKGSFSVAVTDADAFDQDGTSQNILASLLLSPELRGEINDPGYYFKDQSDSLASQLDLVMLTNGWRHFTWQKILAGENYTLRYPVERMQYIAGSIGLNNAAANKTPVSIKLLVMNQDSTKFVGYIIPDSAERFILKDFNHAGLSDIYIQAAGKKNRPLKFHARLFATLADSLKRAKADGFAEQFAPQLSAYYLSGIKNQANNASFIKGIVLNTVNVKEKKITPAEKLIAEHVSPKYESNKEFTLDLVNNPTLNIGLFEYIKGRFPGLQIIGRGLNTEFFYHGRNTLILSPDSPTPSSSGTSAKLSPPQGASLPYFYLDEAPAQFDDLKYLDLTEVALIRFMPPPVWFAPYNGGNVGAIMVYTKKPSDEARTMNHMADYDHFIFNGYSITREFSQPDFVKLAHSGLADNRTTLYWNPDLSARNGILKFGFRNSDRAKKFKIIIQGMDTEGKLAYAEQLFQ